MPPRLEDGAFPCAMSAWNQHENSLLQWLLKETRDSELSRDILQEVFIRILQQRESFCNVENPKAWMFRVAQNLIVDHARKNRSVPLVPETLEIHANTDPEMDAVDMLALSCLPRVLSELDESSREIINACDLQGIKQQTYADQNNLSLTATKSRLRRARAKLKQQIETDCQVKLDENEKVCCFTPRD